MRIWTAAALAIAAVTLAAPPVAAAQATLSVDPVDPCYREQSDVLLVGTGFTPNGLVDLVRGSSKVVDRDTGLPPSADGGGQLSPLLSLPGLESGQQELTYVATDRTNPALTADLTLLVTATDVGLQPTNGPPNRLLTIRARGFFGGRTLYAHVVRIGKRRAHARNMRIGAIKGACKKVKARKRLFFADTAPGRYRVQFDTFRRYHATRDIKTTFKVSVYRRAGTARASGLNPAT